MTRRRHALAALLAAALACAAPAAAVAQNAGDEQYADPFGKTQDKKKPSSGNQGSQQGTAGSSQPTTQSAPTTQASQPTASPSQTLPRTGLPVGLVAAAGTALLGGGAFLRRVTDAPR